MAATIKACSVCGVDVNGRPRTKDQHGRYYCQPCYGSKGRSSVAKSVPTAHQSKPAAANVNQALLTAINAGDVSTLKILLESGADVNANLTPAGGSNTTPLDTAEAWGQDAAANLIRSFGGVRGEPDEPMTNITSQVRQVVVEEVEAATSTSSTATNGGLDDLVSAVNQRVERPSRGKGHSLLRDFRWLAVWFSFGLVTLGIGLLCVRDESTSTIGILLLLIGFLATATVTVMGVIGFVGLGLVKLSGGTDNAFKVFISILVLASVVWLIGSGWYLYTGFRLGGAMGSGQVVGGIISGVLALIAVGVTTIPIQRECPKCHRWLAAICVDSALIDRNYETQEVQTTDRHYDPNYHYIGSTKRVGQKLVTVDKHLNLYRCKHCGHEWTGVTQTKSD